MTAADLIAVGLIALLAIGGFRRGLVTGVLSLVGLVGGAVIGARLAPALLGDAAGRYQPLVALGGAVTLAVLGQATGVLAGRSIRRVLTLPPLRLLDNVGGLVLGLVTGVVLVWAVGAVLLYVPGQTEMRRYAQESTILSTLNRELPPERVMSSLARIDVLIAIAGPAVGVAAPDPAILDDPDARLAAASVVRVTGYACGLGIEGSGWVAAPDLVVTNAHVVAGITHPVVSRPDGHSFAGRVVAFDAHDDIAVIHAPGLRLLALELGRAESGTAAATIGYPENGPERMTAVRLGRTVTLVGRDAYGRFPTVRKVTELRGEIVSGTSGGPVVDGDGRVLTTVFGGRTGAGKPGGYGVPNDAVLRELGDAAAGKVVSTSCVAR